MSTPARTMSNPAAIAVVSLIFFTWGGLTSLNDVLIPHLKAVFSMSYTQTMLIQFTFFGAYFLMSMPAGAVVARVGYKAGIVIGLVIASVGAAMFPFMMPSSSDPSHSLTLWNSSSSQLTLTWMTGFALVFVPMILWYTSWCYYVMRGKVKAEDIENDEHAY